MVCVCGIVWFLFWLFEGSVQQWTVDRNVMVDPTHMFTSSYSSECVKVMDGKKRTGVVFFFFGVCL